MGEANPEDPRFNKDFYKQITEQLKYIKLANKLLLETKNILNESWSQEEVLTALAVAKNGAPGPDKLTNKALKAIFGRKEDAGPLTELINIFWNLGHIPEIWKHSIKKPFHKKGPLNNLDNYRGIALTCCVAKILERLIDTRIRKFAKTNNLLSPLQGGFRKRRDTVENLLVVIEAWYKAKSNGKPLWFTFLDFKKAYDKVFRAGMLHNIWGIGITGKTWEIICAMYTNTTSEVQIGNTTSPIVPIEEGIIQGSVLGPLLFNLFVNRLLATLNSEAKRHSPEQAIKAIFFADDVLTIADNQAENQHMANVCAEFARDNRMLYGIPKCNTMLFNTTSQIKPALGAEQIEFTNKYKYLGIYITNTDNNFETHGEEILKNTHKKHRALSNFMQFNHAPTPEIKSQHIYKKIIRPSLEYGQQILQYSPPLIEKFEMFQTRALTASLGAKVAPGAAVRVLTNTVQLTHRFAQLKAAFIKKTIEKDDCFEKRFLQNKIEQEDSWINQVIATNNLDLNKIRNTSYAQLKRDFRTTSLKEDLTALQDFPLFANGSVDKLQNYPFWLGNCTTHRVIGRSKLIKLILSNNLHPWKTLNEALETNAPDNKINKLWTKIGHTLSKSTSEPTTNLGARFQSSQNIKNNITKTSSIVSDLIWEGDPADQPRRWEALCYLMTLAGALM